MVENFTNNPFVGLFNDPDDLPCRVTENPSPEERQLENLEDYHEKEEKLLQDVFGILRSNSSPIVSKKLYPVDSDTVDGAIYLRIIATNIDDELVSPKNYVEATASSLTLETQTIPYLFGCFCELEKRKSEVNYGDVAAHLQRALIRYVEVVLEDNSCVNGQPVLEQYIDLFKDATILGDVSEFSRELAVMIIEERSRDSEDLLMEAFRPLMKIIKDEISQSNVLSYQQYWFNFLQTMATIEPLAEVLLRFSTPERHVGSGYVDSFLAAPLTLSCLPKDTMDSVDFDLTQSKAIENNIWSAVEYITESMYKIFLSLLKCSSEIRHLTLQWLGRCVEANSDRVALSHEHDHANATSSDGFMINLGHVLLRLSQPFTPKVNTKVPKIDPTYCAYVPKAGEEDLSKYVHLTSLNLQTCLVPTERGQTRPIAKTFNFVTECFFLTQNTLFLGYNVVFDKFVKANRSMMIAQQTYNAQTNMTFEQQRYLMQSVDSMMKKFLAFKTCLSTPDMVDHLMRFHATTAYWLVQVMVEPERADNAETYFPEKYRDVVFPFPEEMPKTWRCIPEFVVENLIQFLSLIRRINHSVFEEHGPSFLEPVLTEIIVLMESPKRLFNPHLRARLAEALEALIPQNDDLKMSALGTFQREQLFLSHPHRRLIVRNLLEVFVSIEMTGQGVQFEQKFNYRRPMYGVMKYLWKIEEHRAVFKALADDAEKNIEAVQPPLFLRFINLLINDAVFLIDEALSNMAQLRNMQNSLNNGEWSMLPLLEQNQRHGVLQQTEYVARFDNILGRKTISTLKMLTTEIRSIFCHPTMVDRIASMLNYILLQLVGPNNRNFKVKGSQDYEFDPAYLVINICEMYIYLGESDNFTLAVSQDGRSYSPDLFRMADSVLVKIGGVSILDELSQLSAKVELAANIKREEDEILTDAPDEFLDPIMSSIMSDPVILPSSKVAIDRQTIARHLLSDQTDPFNRSPLSMDMVKPDVELRNKIQEWIASKKLTKGVSVSK